MQYRIGNSTHSKEYAQGWNDCRGKILDILVRAANEDIDFDFDEEDVAKVFNEVKELTYRESKKDKV